MTGSTSSVCKVTVTGPLVPFADAYQQELKGRGYAPSTIGVKLGQLARLSCWLEVRCLTAGSLTRVVVDEFVAEQRALGDVAFGRRPGLSALVDVLRGLGVLEHEPEPPGSRAEEPLASFERYLSVAWRCARLRRTWRTPAGSWRGWAEMASLPA